jgi:alpha/beta superfamily hydrolase
MSVIGFITYYTHHLDPFRTSEPLPLGSKTMPTMPTIPSAETHATQPPILLLGGYSYGAMVTTQLPPVEQILENFASPAVGSAAAEIRLRAQHLAEHENVVLASRLAALPKASGNGSSSPRRHVSLRVGGDEDQRRSHESRRSFTIDAEEKIRKGVHELLAKTKLASRDRTHAVAREGSQSPPLEHLPLLPDLCPRTPAYLMISPLQGIITNLATMSFLSSASGGFLPKLKGHSQKESTKTPEQNSSHDSAEREAAEAKLVHNPSLAVFGDKDVFVPVGRLRQWSTKLGSTKDSKFQGEEIITAGHFWVEEKVAYTLRDKVVDFASRLLGQDTP